MREIWKPVRRYEGLYKVSNYGQVKSLARLRRHNNKILGKWCKRILKISLRKDKTIIASLWKNNKGKNFIVARLVAAAFIPNPLNKPCVNHIDNNPSNNKINNLEWCTHKENYAHSAKQKRNCYGERNGFSKLKEKDIINIRKKYMKFSKKTNTCSLAKKYKVCQASIWGIINFISWKHI